MSNNTHKHNHSHHHNHSNDLRGKKLLWVALLNFSITIVQIIGGIVSNSLSLLSDALHNLGDSSAIFIAFLAGKISQKKPDKNKTFGYKRIEILAALFNAVALISISIFLFFEAYGRFTTPEPIKGKIMFIVATFGLLANIISVFVLNKDKDHNLNIKAAYLHLMGDTLSSVAVIFGGIAIWIYKIYWIDPVITVLVSIFIIYHTWSVVKQTVDILMQSTPSDINLNELKNKVESIKEVANIHHIHIWKLNDTQSHIEAHINLNTNMNMVEMMKVKEKLDHLLKEKFHLNHIILQIGYECCKGNNNLINT